MIHNINIYGNHDQNGPRRNTRTETPFCIHWRGQYRKISPTNQICYHFLCPEDWVMNHESWFMGHESKSADKMFFFSYYRASCCIRWKIWTEDTYSCTLPRPAHKTDTWERCRIFVWKNRRASSEGNCILNISFSNGTFCWVFSNETKSGHRKLSQKNAWSKTRYISRLQSPLKISQKSGTKGLAVRLESPGNVLAKWDVFLIKGGLKTWHTRNGRQIVL